jgi:hypothetical protein
VLPVTRQTLRVVCGKILSLVIVILAVFLVGLLI